MNEVSNPVYYYQYKLDRWEEINSPVIVETLVSLTVNGEVWFSFMCTPIDLEEMVVGFMYNEGLISSTDEISSVRVCPGGDNVDLWLNHSVEMPKLWKRTSGCTGGITSASLEHKEKNKSFQTTLEYAAITIDQITHMIARLFDSQDLYKKSGGVHTSILTDGEEIAFIGEDIGRHNTLDKIAGKLLMSHAVLREKFILTTGRISSEMIQKAARIGATVLISRTSPSSLSIEIAQNLGITLIGYARRKQFRIYTNPQRIKEYQTRSNLILRQI